MSDQFSIFLSENASKADIERYTGEMTNMTELNFAAYFSGVGPKTSYLFLKDKGERVCGGAEILRAFDFVFLNGIWVEDSLRKQGYGLRLYDEVEQLAKRWGLSRVLLYTSEFFGVLPYWRRLGFQVIGEIPLVPPGERYPKGHTIFYLEKRF